jgi:hypothetical protein
LRDVNLYCDINLAGVKFERKACHLAYINGDAFQVGMAKAF